MDHRDSPPFVRGHHRGKCSGKHDKRKYYEEKLSTEEQIKIAPKAAVDSATVALKKHCPNKMLRL